MCCSVDSSTARKVCWGARAQPTTHPKQQPPLQRLLPYPPPSWQGWLGDVHHPLHSPASKCTARQACTGMLRWLQPPTHTPGQRVMCVYAASNNNTNTAQAKQATSVLHRPTQALEAHGWTHGMQDTQLPHSQRRTTRNTATLSCPRAASQQTAHDTLPTCMPALKKEAHTNTQQ